MDLLGLTFLTAICYFWFGVDTFFGTKIATLITTEQFTFVIFFNIMVVSLVNKQMIIFFTLHKMIIKNVHWSAMKNIQKSKIMSSPLLTFLSPIQWKHENNIPFAKSKMSSKKHAMIVSDFQKMATIQISLLHLVICSS